MDIRLIIAGVVLLVIVGLSATVWVQHAEIRSAKESLRLVTEDRDRQVEAVKQLQTVNADQAAQLERHRVDEAKAAQLAAQVEADRQAQLAKLKSDLSALKEKARAHPDQVRPLGPIVLDALRVQH